MKNKSLTCHTTSERRLINANALCEFFQERYEYLRNASETQLPNERVEIDFEIQVGAIIAKEFLDKAKNAPTVDAVELPCRMGDIVWGIQKHIRGFQPKQGVVNQMYFGEDMQLCICVKNICRGEWGKKVFATKEEADAALAKMDGGNEKG